MKKLAFVTGGRKGIGAACAKALFDDGFEVIVSGRGESADTGNPLIHYIACDNSDTGAIERTVSRILQEHRRIDLLVNNAGVAPLERADILQTTPESFDRVLNTNLRGTFFMCQQVARSMVSERERDSDYTPRIINISSISAYTSSVNRGEYCISKAGISMVTALFADRLAQYGIPVFEVRPGIIMTDMTAAVADKYRAMIHDGLTPIRRPGTPQDVAQCVSALASGKLDFATGQVINADGGFSVRRL